MTTTVTVPAVRTHQDETAVFGFFLRGSRLAEIARISRISKGPDGTIDGFQRPEIRRHVRGIVEYLRRGEVLFPNAIILALAPGVRFVASRGPTSRGADDTARPGWLSIPVTAMSKAAWIVDGQQRALALAEVGSELPVPVIAFVSGDLAVHREQFILVNKARPLDRRLIDELLPQVGALLPRDLAPRRVPSALCAALNDMPGSPFHGMVRRPSHPDGVVTDSVLTAMIRSSATQPRGALAAHVGPDGTPDLDAMLQTLVAFWSAVRDVFPDAWGLPPDRSRLLHGVGVAALGVLMDEVMTRDGADSTSAERALRGIEPFCRWTQGVWPSMGRTWNDLQCVGRDVRALSNLILGLERETRLGRAA